MAALSPAGAVGTMSGTVTAVETIYSVAELEQRQGQYAVFIGRVTADWCISCKIMGVGYLAQIRLRN